MDISRPAVAYQKSGPEQAMYVFVYIDTDTNTLRYEKKIVHMAASRAAPYNFFTKQE